MAFIILGIALLLMIPAACLPLISAAEEQMESDLRNPPAPKPAPAPLTPPATLAPRQAA